MSAPAKPRVYLAGKVGKNDWRHDLAPDLRGWQPEFGSLPCKCFTYVGPFLVACDHGCRHEPGKHGAAGGGCDGENIARDAVFRRNQAALGSADIVWAYVEDQTCHGTLFEIGWAARGGKPVFLSFAPGVDHDELWYPARAAVGAPAIRVVAREDLPKVFWADLGRWRRS